MKMSLIGIVILLFGLNNLLYTQNQIDLSGSWLFSEDNNLFDQEVYLPGSTDEAQIGIRHIPGEKLYTGQSEIWQLAREYVFIDTAWYQKEIIIPDDWIQKRVTLSLERCMWQTRLWINDVYVGEEHSLCTPHRYDVSRVLKPGKNKIKMCIDNTPYVHLGSWSHGYAPGIQTIWNGAIGNLFLEAEDDISLQNIQCYPSLKEKSLSIRAKIVNAKKSSAKGNIQINLEDPNGNEVLSKSQDVTIDKMIIQDFEVTYQLKEIFPWDEFDPNLYTLTIKSEFEDNKDKEEFRIGFRDLSTVNGTLKINGRTAFMRGEHDAGSFPLTGYPSMKKEDWISIFENGKLYGFNHWRFHSWCPPEAAFAAADELGIYLQPELPLFSQDWEHTLIGQDKNRDDFLFEELKRILDTYGNHPSFVFMCMGNELRGNASILEQWVEYGKKHDKRHLYAGSANLEAMKKYLPLNGDDFQVAHAAKLDDKRYERRMGGLVNIEKPNTVNDYSNTLQAPYNNVPIITHELGQWEIFPDFSEIEAYTGVLKPRNLEVFKSRLEQKGMADQAPDFLLASGKLAASIYREEIERVLRTPGIDGFQLLDLHDYPAQGSALIGLLNVFWKSKGLITPEEFRQSCNDVTVLLKMPKRVWEDSETFQGEIVIPNYGVADLQNIDIDWAIYEQGEKKLSGRINKNIVKQGEVTSCGSISCSLDGFKQATKLEVLISVPSLNLSNQYNVWVYPHFLPEQNNSNIIIAQEPTLTLLEQIRDGANVLLVAPKVPNMERMTFANPFWSTILFDYQPKTMGVLCNVEHPLFKDFPTEKWSDWQWWELTADAFSARLNHTPLDYRPILQVIDHPVRNDKLGAIMETRVGKGKLLICMLDILSDLESRPVARQLRYSILKYMNSPEFQPEEVPSLVDVFFSSRELMQYKTVSSTYEYAEYPVDFAFDGLSYTHCVLPASRDSIMIQMELPEERYVVGCTLEKQQGEIGNLRVFVGNDKDNLGEAIIEGNGLNNTKFDAKSWDNGFTIQKGKKGKFVQIQLGTKGEIPVHLQEFQLLFGD